MISSRTRRAQALLVSAATALFVVALVARPALAQIAGDGWPFDDGKSQTQPRSAVQKKLDELYRRDGRPMPDYMRPGANGSAAAPQAPSTPTYGFTPAPGSTLRTQMQPPAPVQWPTQMQPPAAAGSIRQQLSDYYGSQGREMPQAQAAQYPTSDDSQSAPQRPRFRDRLNAFFGFSTSESSSNQTRPASVPVSPNPQMQSPAQLGTPPQLAPSAQFAAPAQVDAAPQPQAPVQPQPDSQAQMVPQPPMPPQWQVTNPPAAPMQPMTTAPAPAMAPQTAVFNGNSAPTQPPQPIAPLHNAANGMVYIELGNGRPLAPSSNPPMPFAEPAPSPVPATPVPAPATQASSVVVGAIPDSQADSPKASPDSEPGRVRMNDQTDSSVTDRIVAKPRTAASADDAPNPFHEVSEAEADQHGSPYTGLTLEDETVPKETAQRRAVARADLNQPAQAAGQINTEAVKVAPHSSRDAAVASRQPGQQPPVSKGNTDSDAPKTFKQPVDARRLVARKETASTKMQRIGERVGQKGLKGFCPVTLRDQRDLADAKLAYCSIYKSKAYYFASAEAKERFDINPSKYAPVAGGVDIVVRANSDQMVEGTLDYAAWYKQRLYLFSSPESLEAFTLSPRSYSAGY